MKKHLFLVFLLLVHISCNQRPKTVSEIGGTIIECKFPDMAKEEETVPQILEILAERVKHIKNATTPTITYSDSSNIFRIEIPGVTDVDAAQLLSHGKIEICEIYAINENESLFRNSILDSLRGEQYIQTYSPDAILFTGVKSEDINAIDSVLELKGLRMRLPENLKFCWSLHEDKNMGGYALYTVKKSRNSLNLNETHKSSQIKSNPHGFGQEIYIDLNHEGGRCFSTLTQNNIGRTLVILMDEKVISAPMVHSKIDGGALVISGGFDEKEASALLTLLNTKEIKSEPEIISIQIFKDKK